MKEETRKMLNSMEKSIDSIKESKKELRIISTQYLMAWAIITSTPKYLEIQERISSLGSQIDEMDAKLEITYPPSNIFTRKDSDLHLALYEQRNRMRQSQEAALALNREETRTFVTEKGMAFEMKPMRKRV